MKKAYFLSDMHLGASYMEDSRVAERRVTSFLDSIKDEAAEIYLLGDVLDYWYEYRYVVPRGYVRFFGKLAELVDAGVRITWVIGNHDIWIYDYIPSEIGVEVFDGVLLRDVLGTPMVMAHGDGVWQETRKFRFLRSLFRNKVCQKLFSSIHPRWTVPFAYSWSRHSRETGGADKGSTSCEVRDLRMQRNIAGLRAFCEKWLKNHPGYRYFLFGHLHELIRETITPDSDKHESATQAEMIVLGEWLTLFSYAVFDGREMRLERYDPTPNMRKI
ncbi:MAG: UDP-2,3-diacylglucosamine diphosphatase [Muribaculaceae bacterium]|nr:UDP-2,3-diacylglucosamine diphosphatase [Muribaculaceae bacterium]